jgi:hypothetical protein
VLAMKIQKLSAEELAKREAHRCEDQTINNKETEKIIDFIKYSHQFTLATQKSINLVDFLSQIVTSANIPCSSLEAIFWG